MRDVLARRNENNSVIVCIKWLIITRIQLQTKCSTVYSFSKSSMLVAMQQSLARLDQRMSFAETDSVNLGATTKVLAGNVAGARVTNPTATSCTACPSQMSPIASRCSPAVRPVHRCNLRVRVRQTGCTPASQCGPSGARSGLKVAQSLRGGHEPQRSLKASRVCAVEARATATDAGVTNTTRNDRAISESSRGGEVASSAGQVVCGQRLLSACYALLNGPHEAQHIGRSVLPKHNMTAHLERAKQVIGHRAHTGAGAGSTRSAGRARQTNAPALQECALTVRAWLVHILQVRAPELFARSHAPHGTHK